MNTPGDMTIWKRLSSGRWLLGFPSFLLFALSPLNPHLESARSIEGVSASRSPLQMVKSGQLNPLDCAESEQLVVSNTVVENDDDMALVHIIADVVPQKLALLERRQRESVRALANEVLLVAPKRSP